MMSGGPTLQQVTIGGGSGQQQGMGPGAPLQQGQPGMRRLNIIIWLCYTLKSCIHLKALNQGSIDLYNKGSWLLRHRLYLFLVKKLLNRELGLTCIWEPGPNGIDQRTAL